MGRGSNPGTRADPEKIPGGVGGINPQFKKKIHRWTELFVGKLITPELIPLLDSRVIKYIFVAYI
jgi:hypothetical protein